MAWQRARRGYADDQLWSLNATLAELIVAGASLMRDRGVGYPSTVEPAEWQGTLEAIRRGFQEWIDAGGWLEEGSDAEARFRDAMANLATWFGDLWD